VGLKPILRTTTSFSALTLSVGSFDPYKLVPDMTYNVLSGTLNPNQINRKYLERKNVKPLQCYCECLLASYPIRRGRSLFWRKLAHSATILCSVLWWLAVKVVLPRCWI